jgi:hypothetical protein
LPEEGGGVGVEVELGGGVGELVGAAGGAFELLVGSEPPASSPSALGDSVPTRDVQAATSTATATRERRGMSMLSATVRPRAADVFRLMKPDNVNVNSSRIALRQ